MFAHSFFRFEGNPIISKTASMRVSKTFSLTAVVLRVLGEWMGKKCLDGNNLSSDKWIQIIFFIQMRSLNFLFHKDFFPRSQWKWKNKKNDDGLRLRGRQFCVKEISFLSCCDLRDNIWTLTRSIVQMLDDLSHLCSSAATDVISTAAEN